MKQNQQTIKTSIITIISAGSLGALLVLGGVQSAGAAKIFGIALLLIIYSITAVICMVTAEKLKYKSIGTAGIVTSGGGFLLSSIALLSNLGDVSLLQLSGALLIASIALAHISLLFHFNIRNKYAHYARTTAVAAIAVFAFLFIIRLFDPLSDLYMLAYSQSGAKLLVAALLVDLSATALVPLCNRLNVPVEIPEIPSLPETTEETTPPPATNEQAP